MTEILIFINILVWGLLLHSENTDIEDQLKNMNEKINDLNRKLRDISLYIEDNISTKINKI